ncbi:MAG: DUF92 domain-containing protein [Acidobacteria bacterium]|nr:DUF92 domain-containing protein [Acidobacteriota bacterium]
MSTEIKRKLVHISMVAFALLIGRVPPWAICLCCALALINNLFVLPLITGRSLERDLDRQRGFALGIVLYPAVLLLLSLIFYRAQVFLAVGWGAMAIGDGFAGLMGARFGRLPVPWRPEKSMTGSFAFVAFGSLGTLFLLYCLPEDARLGLSLMGWVFPVVCAMVFAAWAETLPGLIDDNLAVPLTASLVSWLAASAHQPTLPPDWLWGACLVILLVIGSIASRKIDFWGGLVGGLLAACVFLGSGLAGLSVLFTFFVLGSTASSFGKRAKAAAGLAQENEGRRSIRHALANGGFSAMCGVTVWLAAMPSEWGQVMLAASLASATADTLSSELGNVYGRRYVNILTFKQEQRGLDGVISLEGSLFGVLGALIVGLVWLAWTGNLKSAGVIAAAGIIGNLVDSVLGATIQRTGAMSNDSVNFANTASAGLAALFILI